MTVFIALLRGINVGGNKRIKMSDLKALCEGMGFMQVQTLLQSGNVVFQSAVEKSEQLTAQLESAIAQRFGFEVKIVLRTYAEWQSVVAQQPLSAEQLAQPEKLLVTFLQSAPSESALQTLREAHKGTEIIHALGRELYIYYPDGMGRATLDNGFIERKLRLTATGRNWNTVGKLLDLAAGVRE